MIPENIYTLQWVASWNSQEKGGVLGLCSLEFKTHGGFSSEIPDGEDSDSLLEIIDLITFLLNFVNQANTQPQKQD